MNEVKWIKITTDIFDDEKILLIESMPAADSIIVIWFKLLTLAGKQNNSGVFMMNDRIAYTDEMLATIFRRDVNTVRMALSVFEEFGMIEIIDSVITIPNWGKHQSLDRMESRKQYMRNYMKGYRAKQKLIAGEPGTTADDDKANCKVNGKANVSEADKDIDKDKDRDEEKESIKEKESVSSILKSISSPSLKAELTEFVKYREQSKHKITPLGLKRILNKAQRQVVIHGEEAVIACIEKSIINGWRDIYYDDLNKAVKTVAENNHSPDDKWGIRYDVDGTDES